MGGDGLMMATGSGTTCAECGGPVIWVDDAIVCLICGEEEPIGDD